MKFQLRYVVIGLMIASVACSKVPDGIIQPDEMAEIMADIHMGEAVVDANYSEYQTDSTRMLLKQSIMAKHGYTVTDLDTSLAWYGANLEQMMMVYEQTTKILEKRLAEGGYGGYQVSGSSVASGDSADVWPGVRSYIIRPTMPLNVITFSLKRDPSWLSGDSYTLSGTFQNSVKPIRFYMAAEYSDGTIEMLNTRFSNSGHKSLTFYTDSVKTANRVFGSIEFDLKDSKAIIADSLRLVRKPLDERTYPQRYRQKTERFYNLNNHDNESE